MALTRKLLKALGIEDEKIEQIITAHSESVDALKAEIEQKEDEVKNVAGIRAENESLKKELEQAKANTKAEEYEALKKEFENFKATTAKEKETSKKKNAILGVLKEIGIGEKQALKLSNLINLESFSVDESGAIVDREKVKNAQKEEWADFISVESSEGDRVENPPEGSEADEIAKMDNLSMSDYIKYRSKK